jgi:membrane protease YdiL (CAAX protease family)
MKNDSVLKNTAKIFFSVLVYLLVTQQVTMFLENNIEIEFVLLIKSGFKLLLLIWTLRIILKGGYFRKALFFRNQVMSHLIILVIGYFSLQIAFAQPVSKTAVFAFLLSCGLTGFFEEAFFRVFLFQILENNYKSISWNKRVLVVSSLFGVVHITGFFKDMDWISIVNQVVFAFAMGVFFQCLLAICKNYLLIAALHMFVNFLGSFKSYFSKPHDYSPSTMDDFFSTQLVVLLFSIFIVLPNFYFAKKQEKSVTDL